MIKNLFLTFILLFFIVNNALAHIDVVYPTTKKITVNASSIFFIGNTTNGSIFSINKKNAKLWNNNFFVEVIPLEYGKNKIKLESCKNGETEELVYEITRPKPAKFFKNKTPKFEEKNEGEILYTKTIKDNSTIRDNPSKNSKRIVDLPQNIILYLSGKQGEYYKIEEQGKTEYWIHKSNIQEPTNLSVKTTAKLKNKKSYEDELYKYTKFYLSHPVLYTTEQIGNSLKLTLYGIETTNNDGTISPNFEYNYYLSTPILGYEGHYEENTFIFKIAQTPNIENEEEPLKGIKIFVDAGHGGSEKGAVGPTRVNEKDINLAIANYLVEELQKEGADVITSRTTDRKIGLYERVGIAKENNALISISIHNNSLPNGKDPYIKHGTEVHYYNENAKLLSDIIQKDLVINLNIKDGGIHKSSFALNRSTNPVSVLVEVAYMINPNEYMQLQKSDFQKAVAKSIKNSIKKYIIIMTNEKNMI